MSLQLVDGSIFASRYQVVRRIAMGGMGAVYEVEHIETLRHLALKVMLPHIVQSAEMRDRFRREARAAAHIESEHIVQVLDAGIDDVAGVPFMVMELLRGEELAQALRRVGRFAPAAVVTFLHQAALALDKTHRALIVHRDLKPENLFLTLREDGQPRIQVLDFGIAKLVAEGASGDPSTRSLGTPLYMAPEQFRSDQPISPATDVYALGMIAFTLLVGGPYWADEAKTSSNVFAFAGSVMAGPREPATARARRQGVTLPAAFDAWFSRITALGPGDRFPTALTAVVALREVLGTPLGTGLVSSPPTGVLHPPAGIGWPAAPAPPLPSNPTPTDLDTASTMIYLGGGTGPQSAPSPPSGPALQPQPAWPVTSAPAALAWPVPQPTPGPASQPPLSQPITNTPWPHAPPAPEPPAMDPRSATGMGAYGSTRGAPATSVSKGKLVGAIVAGVGLGAVALVAFLVIHPVSPSGDTSSKAAAATAGTALPPSAAAPSSAAAPPSTPTDVPRSVEPVPAAPATVASATEAPAAEAPATETPATEAPTATATAAPAKAPSTPPHTVRKAPADTGKKSIFVRD